MFKAIANKFKAINEAVENWNYKEYDEYHMGRFRKQLETKMVALHASSRIALTEKGAYADWLRKVREVQKLRSDAVMLKIGSPEMVQTPPLAAMH